MPLFDFVEWVGSSLVSYVYFFLRASFGGPCIRPVYFGVLFSITNIYISLPITIIIIIIIIIYIYIIIH